MQGSQDFSREAGDFVDKNHYNTKVRVTCHDEH